VRLDIIKDFTLTGAQGF